ncbi:MAG: SDR family NAD(P)-dependent oxidoreductase [Gaiellaceae bacterium]
MRAPSQARGQGSFLAGRTLAKVEAVAAEISAVGGLAEAAQVDALEEDAIEKHAAAVVETAGSIDVLFNALGMEDSQGTALLDMSLEEFAHPVRIATRAPFLTARAVARHMQGARTVGAL